MKKIIARVLIFLNIHLISKRRKELLYMVAIAGIKEYPQFICNALIVNMLPQDRYKVRYCMFLFFPEVYLQKPSKPYKKDLWFGWDNPLYFEQDRVNVLKEALKLLQK